jgi:hypothetical protein
MAFVMDEVALGQVFLRVLLFHPVNIIPTLLHIRSCIIWGMKNGPFRGLGATSAHRNNIDITITADFNTFSEREICKITLLKCIALGGPQKQNLTFPLLHQLTFHQSYALTV